MNLKKDLSKISEVTFLIYSFFQLSISTDQFLFAYLYSTRKCQRERESLFN